MRNAGYISRKNQTVSYVDTRLSSESEKNPAGPLDGRSFVLSHRLSEGVIAK